MSWCREPAGGLHIYATLEPLPEEYTGFPASSNGYVTDAAQNTSPSGSAQHGRGRAEVGSHLPVPQYRIVNITKNIPEWNLGSDVALTDETEDNVE